MLICQKLQRVTLITFCFVLSSVILVKQVYADDVTLCRSSDVNNYFKAFNLKQLSINTKKSRKWAKNYFKILSNEKHNILPKYKKEFKATIDIVFTNGVACSFIARLRVNGDWKDHVEGAPSLISSLDVKLKTGNIDSVVKFKLLLPETRNGDNEIFVTSILREIGFISPKTYYVPTIFNGVKFTYLFQEKAQKEMLEAHKLREGPILVGDERFTWLQTDQFALDHRLGLARLVNKNWANKGIVSLEISQQAVSLLNIAYIDFMARSFVDENAETGKPPMGWLLDPKILSNGNNFAKRKNEEFFAIMVALQATHGLRPHNRKFYYDPIYKYLLPIYYDGNSSILDNKQEKLDPDFFPNGHSGANEAISSIKTIDRNILLNNLKRSGIKTTLAQLNRTLDKIHENLNKILELKVGKRVAVAGSYFSKYIEPNKLLAFSGSNPLKLVLCDFSMNHCIEERHNIKDYALILNGRFTNHLGQKYLYVGTDQNSYEKGKWKKQVDSTGKLTQIIGKNTQLITTKLMQVTVDKISKTLFLAQTNSLDRALIVGGKLKDWQIVFKGITSKVISSPQRFNKDLITGCLTLLDVELEDIRITSSNSPCEDAINLMRVHGNLTSVNISGAMSDAIDTDFSQLVFDKITVNNAGNDCVDFSAGTYQVNQATLRNCNDKAISIGEQSTSTLRNIDISHSSIGIAAKDSSQITITNTKIQNVSTCYSSSKKKQEFWGSKIIVQKSKCDADHNFQQSGSLIEFYK